MGEPDELSQYAAKDDADDLAKFAVKTPPTKEPGFLDRDIPLSGPAADMEVPGTGGLLKMGATASGLQSVGRGIRSAVKGFGSLLDPRPQEGENEVKGGIIPYPLVRAGKAITETAKQVPEIPGAIRDINASPDPLAHYAKAAQDTAGEGAGQALVAAGTEGLTEVPVADAAKATVRGAGKTYNVARKVGSTVAPVAGVVEGGVRLAHGDPVGALYSTMGGGVAGRAIKALPEAPDSITSFGKPLGKGAIYPGAKFPENPGAKSLAEGGKPISDQSSALGKIAPPKEPPASPAAEPAPSKQPVSRIEASRKLQDLLGNATGAQELKPNVPLKDQLPALRGKTPDVTEGHTPVESSAMKSYQYDPAAKEFHAKYSSSGNTVHVFGDVSPEEAEVFNQAKSKGSALGQIQKSHPLVAKIVNGKRISVKGASAGQ